MVHPAVVVSAACYAILNAARAALSERGEYAKTHSGTWTLFSKVFVSTGEFDRELSSLAGLGQGGSGARRLRRSSAQSGGRRRLPRRRR
jgi:hypothetical protein